MRSSGGIYSLLLTAATRAFTDRDQVVAGDWVEALQLGLAAVSEYGGAGGCERRSTDQTNTTNQKEDQSVTSNILLCRAR